MAHLTGDEGVVQEDRGPQISDLRFRFGTRDLKPRTRWNCPQDCGQRCSHAGADEMLVSEDGRHIELELEHTQ